MDVYANLLPPLLTIFHVLYGLSYTAMGVLTAVFSVTSTLVQPVFGFVADRYGQKWIAALGVAWVAVGMCVLSAARDFGAMLIIVGLAGLGSAMFHPQASAMVPRVSGPRKSLGMSIFMAGGNIGYSIMTLLAIIIWAMFGLSALVWLIPPGIAVALLLYAYAPRMNVDRRSSISLKALSASFRTVRRPLATLLGVVSLRAWVCMGMITFIGTYFKIGDRFAGWTLLGYDIGGIGYAVTLFLFILANALGGIAGGWAADRFGARAVIAPTLIAAAPFLYLAFVAPDALVWPLIVIGGALMYASVSPTTLQAQELLPRSQGMAGGLVLGFANGIGGLLVFVTGLISDHFGLFAGIGSLVGIIVLSGLLATLLPGEPAKIGAPTPTPGQ